MLIVDTGPLLATADAADPDHKSCRMLLESYPGPLVTSSLVISETGWLIRRQLGIKYEAEFYRAVSAGELLVETLTNGDWQRISELIETYSELKLDAADASLVALSERLNLESVATLDHRDFSVVIPKHRTQGLQILPHTKNRKTL